MIKKWITCAAIASVLGGALTMACASSKEGPGQSVETEGQSLKSADGISVNVSDRVLPEQELLQYRAFGQDWVDGKLEPLKEVTGLEAQIKPTATGRSIQVKIGDQVQGISETDANGRARADSADFAVGADILRPLPPPGERLTVGSVYENAPPSPAYVQANADKNNLTMYERVESKVTHISRLDEQTLVRVSNRAFYRVIGVPGIIEGDTSTEPYEFETGLAWVGVTDLLHSPGKGWRVLRIARLSSKAEEVNPESTLSDLRAQPHAVFTACAKSSSLLGESLGSQGLANLPKVPELSACVKR